MPRGRCVVCGGLLAAGLICGLAWMTRSEASAFPSDLKFLYDLDAHPTGSVTIDRHGAKDQYHRRAFLTFQVSRKVDQSRVIAANLPGSEWSRANSANSIPMTTYRKGSWEVMDIPQFHLVVVRDNAEEEPWKTWVKEELGSVKKSFAPASKP